jgi:hypothetical protein
MLILSGLFFSSVIEQDFFSDVGDEPLKTTWGFDEACSCMAIINSLMNKRSSLILSIKAGFVFLCF